jgi:hypothetical protein
LAGRIVVHPGVYRVGHKAPSVDARYMAAVKARGVARGPADDGAGRAHFVDCRWPEYRLTVELDSYKFHRTRYAWEQDREREWSGSSKASRQV